MTDGLDDDRSDNESIKMIMQIFAHFYMDFVVWAIILCANSILLSFKSNPFKDFISQEMCVWAVSLCVQNGNMIDEQLNIQLQLEQHESDTAWTK